MGFGISINKRFAKEVYAFYPSGDSVTSGKLTVKGHFYAQIDISLPLDQIKLKNGKTLDEYLDLEVQPMIMIDFGRVGATVQRLINDFQHMNKHTAKNIVNTLKRSGAEALFNIDGKATFKINDLTGGILPDFSTTGQAAWIMSLGGGSTGLPTGLYFSIRSNIVREIINYVLGIVDVFGPFLNAKQINIPFPDVEVYLGMFITPEYFGFGFNFARISVQCKVKYGGFRLSCSINGSFFDMLKEGLQFVFREATRFFSNTGKEIGRFSAQAWNDSVREVSKGIREAAGFVKNASGQLLKIGSWGANHVAKGTIQGFNYMRNGAKELVDITGRTLSQAKRAAEEAARRAAEVARRAAEAAKRAAQKVKRFFKKWTEVDENGNHVFIESEEGLKTDEKFVNFIEAANEEYDKMFRN